MKKLLITLTIIIAAVLYAPFAAAVKSGYKTIGWHTVSVSTDANLYTPRAKSIYVTARKTGNETVYYRFTLQKKVSGKWKDQRSAWSVHLRSSHQQEFLHSQSYIRHAPYQNDDLQKQQLDRVIHRCQIPIIFDRLLNIQT